MDKLVISRREYTWQEAQEQLLCETCRKPIVVRINTNGDLGIYCQTCKEENGKTITRAQVNREFVNYHLLKASLPHDLQVAMEKQEPKSEVEITAEEAINLLF